MKNPTITDIITEYLQHNGYDGFYNEDGECCCFLADLMPCCEPGAWNDCCAGYKCLVEYEDGQVNRIEAGTPKKKPFAWITDDTIHIKKKDVLSTAKQLGKILGVTEEAAVLTLICEGARAVGSHVGRMKAVQDDIKRRRN